jgi:hypothetical protein
MLSTVRRSLVRAIIRPTAMAAAAILLVLTVSTSACNGRLFGRVYEYEEQVTLALDGTADVVVNASIPALVALRGMDLNLDPIARVDTDKIRAAYTSPVSTVLRVSRPWRRQGRRFIQVRVRVSDIRKLSDTPPFSWSTYALGEKDDLAIYRQTVGPSALRPGTLKNVGWTGGELVSFRLHLPSRIAWHNARDLETNATSDIGRGNILTWEQQLTDRLDGKPIVIEVRMERQSILHRTLWLFAGAFAAAVLVMGGIIWWTMRKGAAEE